MLKPDAKARWDSLWYNVQLATMQGGRYGVIEGGAIAVKDGRIAWLGKAEEIGRAHV